MADVAAGGNGNGIVEVPLAQTGEGIAECKLLKWFVREVDQVDEFQPLCEVQSDKATIEITSRYLGKFLSFSMFQWFYSRQSDVCSELTVVCSFRGFQRRTVQSMSMAAKVLHFHYVEDIKCDALVELKNSFQSNNTDSNVKHTFLPL
ncbi:lipoamide acyltransferase component of branched-chain alpha-keto acid dehydrogenase complex [Pyrus ussuriensis x Pyrus communis]|uniref:Dihydrolipoamide acetyltransferase component of pyruvate dehydrogenase complex n=1 Tax=Pyrus ussuriensis x Pyrus communis TaxID=2448454 RepID=A0A5N5F8V0_9ROSA|nr:lipoamide acyltransferase component of branched-chain alpha-keto acid dehydrogenase complex [Pyrus ussuriensis x Pyrus communis]